MCIHCPQCGSTRITTRDVGKKVGGATGAIAGGATGVATFVATGVGLVATPSPGSIFAYMAVTPPGNHFGVILGILLAAAVSFTVTFFILKASKNQDEDLAAAQAKSKTMKSGTAA